MEGGKGVVMRKEGVVGVYVVSWLVASLGEGRKVTCFLARVVVSGAAKIVGREICRVRGGFACLGCVWSLRRICCVFIVKPSLCRRTRVLEIVVSFGRVLVQEVCIVQLSKKVQYTQSGRK